MLYQEPSFSITQRRSHNLLPVRETIADGADMAHRPTFEAPMSAGSSHPYTRKATADGPTCARVGIFPADTVQRQMRAGQSLTVEIVQSAAPGRIEQRYCAKQHLLIACEEGVRQDGETVLGDRRSTLHNLTGKLTFIPAGHAYHDWQRPRTPVRLVHLYLEPTGFQVFSDDELMGPSLRAQLLFEDKTIWNTVLKLKRLAESPAPEDQRYFDALGAVLILELIRLNHGTKHSEPPIRGGLAVWQQRIVTAYIEEHLTEAISLQTLAQLARLSPHYFCRAFKHTFGLPPHRYHSIRRMERAKAMLASSNYSVTEIGIQLGFSETSSFSTAFRKVTGLTPTAYHRTLA